MGHRREFPLASPARALAAAALVVGLVLPGAFDRHSPVERSGSGAPPAGVAVEIAAVHGGVPAHFDASRGVERESCLACALLAQTGGTLLAAPWRLVAPEPLAAAPPPGVAARIVRPGGAPSGRAPPLV